MTTRCHVQFKEALTAAYAKTETLWEGIFSLVSAIFILITGLAFVRLDRARIKWRIKLAAAFSNETRGSLRRNSSTWALAGLPFLTLVREGLEGVVFVAGVGLFPSALSRESLLTRLSQVAISDSPRSLPLSIVGGVVVGSLAAFVLYRSTSNKAVPMRTFINISSSLLFLVGAGEPSDPFPSRRIVLIRPTQDSSREVWLASKPMTSCRKWEPIWQRVDRAQDRQSHPTPSLCRAPEPDALSVTTSRTWCSTSTRST